MNTQLSTSRNLRSALRVPPGGRGWAGWSLHGRQCRRASAGGSSRGNPSGHVRAEPRPPSPSGCRWPPAACGRRARPAEPQTNPAPACRRAHEAPEIALRCGVAVQCTVCVSAILIVDDGHARRRSRASPMAARTSCRRWWDGLTYSRLCTNTPPRHLLGQLSPVCTAQG
jgi:hypothetical protein